MINFLEKTSQLISFTFYLALSIVSPKFIELNKTNENNEM